MASHFQAPLRHGSGLAGHRDDDHRRPSVPELHDRVHEGLEVVQCEPVPVLHGDEQGGLSALGADLRVEAWR
jgi:hypothetical protein